jgi:hypothetical protein
MAKAKGDTLESFDLHVATRVSFAEIGGPENFHDVPVQLATIVSF